MKGAVAGLLPIPAFAYQANYTSMHQRTYLLAVLLSLFFCIPANDLQALSYRVLFLGNSYTDVNNLPAMVRDVALSAGDTVIFDSYTPGGYQLRDHTLDPISQSKIMSGGWHYVVIQGQSQEPITLYSQFVNGGLTLYNMIKQYNPCAVTVSYMTWGRKNGDASNCAAFPVMCTYQGMDTTLRHRYLDLTASLNGETAPVSVVWNYLRQNHPGIELYQVDGSHPSAAGSYAAACCFYTVLFKKDPARITFNPGLDAATAAAIRNAVRTMVFDRLQSWDFKRAPVSRFSYRIGQGINEVIFTPLSQGVRQTYSWDFGDGTTSDLPSPTHSYVTDGTYTVSLTTTNCDLQGLRTSSTDTVIQFCSHTPTIYTTRPWLCHYDTLWTQAADAYQWFVDGVRLPETNRYLADYSRYGITGFSVMATLNGCSELSIPYTTTAELSGYYFDALGDPCEGDTVAFAVLHTNGFLSGSENILWFKNGALLPLMTGEDTLLITTSGSYECKVSNPNAVCPFDTTVFLIEFDCGGTGIEEKEGGRALSWMLSPNPASEMIRIKFSAYPADEWILVYSAIGRLDLSMPVSAAAMDINIADLPGGLYYVRTKSNTAPALKFMKL